VRTSTATASHGPSITLQLCLAVVGYTVNIDNRLRILNTAAIFNAG